MSQDPLTGLAWPRIPASWLSFVESVAKQSGFFNFMPDVCLVNRYAPGNKLSLHQDRDEQDFTQPIVSISLGISAHFLMGGLKRKDKTQTILLNHGDVIVWGGVSRMRYHGISVIKNAVHPQTNSVRFNLTFRRSHS
jgi:alkylated DNA repair protein (DNA oxidative demethylase)